MNSPKHRDTKLIFRNQLQSVAFLYTSIELTEREIKKTVPLTVAFKLIKYLGIKLTKDVKICTQKIIRY